MAEALKTPSVCRNCHPDQSPDVAQAAVEAWRGTSRSGRRPAARWAERLVEDGSARSRASRWLEVAAHPGASALVRASAWVRFASLADGAPDLDQLEALRDSESGLLRLALIEVARRLPSPTRITLVAPLLADPLRAVRVAAAEALSEDSDRFTRTADRSRFARAMREYRDVQRANLERPEAWVNLGVLDAQQGDLDRAEAAYREALERQPTFVPAYVNWADLARARGQREESVALLGRALESLPEDPELRYAYGLALHRAERREEALREFARAAAEAPDSARLTLAWALAVDSAGRRGRALTILQDAIERGTKSPDLFHAWSTLLRDAGELDRASAAAAAWQAAYPQDRRARALVRSLDARSRD